MTNSFFTFSSPRHILYKAKRDLISLRNNLNIDNVFNFFVTAYHIVDYVKSISTIPQSDIDALYENEDFRMCRFICNKGKHITLIRGDEFDTYRHPGSTLGDFTLGETLLGVGEAYLVIGEEGQIEVLHLAERVIAMWEEFFQSHDFNDV
ncbi:MAG: hypothetical protein KAV87_09075 [Desulfobacteraceae bacterium]|nr:hypothetical protein [Desulfobacteraceae bacterium]